MAISDRLNKLTTDITNAYTSINNKGGTIPANKNTNNLSTAIDSIQSSNIIGATAEGESLNLANTKAMPYSDYVVKGKSVQEGTPSPSNPSEIHSVADDVNLFDGNANTINSGTIKTIINTGVRITLSSSGTFRYSGIEIGGAELLGKTITLYSTITPSSNNDGAIFLYYGNSSNMAVSAVTGGGLTNTGSKTTTIANEFPTNCDRIYGLFYANRNGTGNTNDYVDYTNLKIQYRDTAAPYSPYGKGTVTIKQRGTTENNDYIIQTEPLRSLPNGVKDTIEAEQHRKIGRRLLQASDIKDIVTTGTVPYVRIAKTTLGMVNGTFANNTALMRSYAITGNISYLNTPSGQFNTYYDKYFLAIFDDRFTDLETAKQLLEGEEIIYELKTEVIEPLTQNQATTMLDIIKTGSYESTTNIYTDEDVKPTMKVVYYKKA